jgi:hypothetical protein
LTKPEDCVAVAYETPSKDVRLRGASCPVFAIDTVGWRFADEASKINGLVKFLLLAKDLRFCTPQVQRNGKPGKK